MRFSSDQAHFEEPAEGQNRENGVDAAELLVTSWPTDDGEEYIRAVRTCLDAFDDVVPAQAVRDVLVRAANEDQILHLSLVI